jgi:hypothetical protein
MNKKHVKKIVLSKETLRHLTGAEMGQDDLEKVAGAALPITVPSKFLELSFKSVIAWLREVCRHGRASSRASPGRWRGCRGASPTPTAIARPREPAGLSSAPRFGGVVQRLQAHQGQSLVRLRRQISQCLGYP